MFIKGSAANFIIGYHCQEHRKKAPLLKNPLPCEDNKAWLGEGYYYFWVEEVFAHHWGEDFKDATGYYDIYKCEINTDNLLDTVFNYDHYIHFRTKIETAIKKLTLRGVPVSIDKVHKWLKDEVWSKTPVTGIVYSDISTNKARFGVIHPLYYIKRIQIATFDLQIIHNFAPDSISNKCA